MKKSTMVDVTIFANPNGLGHVTRNYAVFQHLNNISTKYFSAGEAGQYLKKIGVNFEETIDNPKLKIKNGSLVHNAKWLWGYYQYHKNCLRMYPDLIKKEKPRLVIGDEDYAALDLAQKVNIPTVAITNALELHFTKGLGRIIEGKMDKAMQNILKKCDVVIVPLEGEDHGNVKYVGPIARSIYKSREELREKFSFTKKTIVVSVGGTDLGNFLIEKTIQAHSKIKNEVDLAIVPGPSIKKDYGNNIRNLGFVENLHELIYAADLIICLAGASTVGEAKAFGTPGIFIPIKNHFEQEDNAKREGFSYDDIERLDSLISQKLEEARKPIKNNGSKLAAEIINKFVS